jgi:hypothetical protein
VLLKSCTWVVRVGLWAEMIVLNVLSLSYEAHLHADVRSNTCKLVYSCTEAPLRCEVPHFLRLHGSCNVSETNLIASWPLITPDHSSRL